VNGEPFQDRVRPSLIVLCRVARREPGRFCLDQALKAAATATSDRAGSVRGHTCQSRTASSRRRLGSVSSCLREKCVQDGKRDLRCARPGNLTND